MKQAIRGIVHFLYFFSLLFTGFALIFAVAKEGNAFLLIASVISFILAAAGAVLNFTSPSYKNEEELADTLGEYRRDIEGIDKLRLWYLKKLEELEKGQ